MKLRLIIDLSQNNDGTHFNRRLSRIVEIPASVQTINAIVEHAQFLSDELVTHFKADLELIRITHH